MQGKSDFHMAPGSEKVGIILTDIEEIFLTLRDFGCGMFYARTKKKNS